MPDRQHYSSFEDFLDKMLQEKFPHNSTAENSRFKPELRPLLVKTTNLALFAAMPPARQTELNGLMERDDFTEQKFQDFLAKHVDGDQTVIAAQALIKYKITYLRG